MTRALVACLCLALTSPALADIYDDENAQAWADHCAGALNPQRTNSYTDPSHIGNPNFDKVCPPTTSQIPRTLIGPDGLAYTNEAVGLLVDPDTGAPLGWYLELDPTTDADDRYFYYDDGWREASP